MKKLSEHGFSKKIIMNKKVNIEDWKPYFLIFGKNAYSTEFPFERNIGYYERNWFCNELGIIHHNEKEVLNCVHCSKKYYKPK